MLQKEECYQLGTIVRLHGFKGEVSILLDVTSPNDYKKLESVFVEIDKQLIPFFLEHIQLSTKNFARVKFEGVNTEEDAKRLVQKQLYLPLAMLPPLSGKHFYDHEVIGFNVIDSKYGGIGKLVQIIDLPNNPLIEINLNGIEILVPLRSDTVLTILRQEKEIHIQTPEGLIELYTQGGNTATEDE